MNEYDVLVREAQIDRWATLLDVAPFPDDVADDVFTSPTTNASKQHWPDTKPPGISPPSL